MAVGLEVLKNYHPVKGVRIGIAQAGIKYAGRNDLVIFELAQGSRVSGVFTLNAFCAAPVQVSKKHLTKADVRYLVINTGNANAGTGPQGMSDALATCEQLAQLTGVAAHQILPFSTGVIGEPLPMVKLLAGLPTALANLASDVWSVAAEGIMTTDTLPKGYSQQVEIAQLDGNSIDSKNTDLITISGISKGAGMIMPNMATMLAYLTTDAVIAKPLLDIMCKELADKSFNRVTIDGDTSTNDSCMLIATAQAEMAEISSKDDPRYGAMFDALLEAFMILSHAIVRDGEGATKFVTMEVQQAASVQEALDVAYTVAHSPLVKTALFACDANWGRILAAVGRAGVQNMILEDIDIYLDDVCIVKSGGRAASYTEEAGAAIFAQPEITISIRLGRGDITERVWTTDLSHEYVSINADYRS
ncbi:Bifunctional ornithine acetyltransferase/N-acetylglutamate synthase protein [Oleispira antarctica RB-8]|uniref:Arginine biosynthesis bifunctional protein ArgJ n=1 Tax=Oleispira antarctica RB-8 TaxID=698738 RepID=R4YUW8_OLEAN|nr:Bifunctional ornithine acetyltransferase/N-acetylglutamate synthase protein [Oleispira antarctica RB-8]|tara:strand:- start:766 stop:2019 length:1254 start_codon:yes stop_codon:yes gene_type:complete